MKWLLCLACTVFGILACGGRSPMEDCAPGSDECTCLAGTCNRGLVCIDDQCVRPSGGTWASGGHSSIGGTGGAPVAGGGTPTTGGRSGSGGWNGTGGIVATGGRSGSGGWSRTGGFVTTGGRRNSGGNVGTGGRIGTGGFYGSGGRTGAGGNTAIVGFSNGKGNGFVDGWGWVALGAADSLGSPTCLGQPITANTPCTTATTWSSATGLCIQGFVPALPSNPTLSDYDMNWGIIVAVECHEPPAPLGASFQSIKLFVSGSPATGLRAVVHRAGDPAGTNYCAIITSDAAIPFTSFNTTCWNGEGTALTLADVPNLDWIGIQVPSMTSAAIRTDLCLTSLFLLP